MNTRRYCVNEVTGCHVWTGLRDKYGYGVVTIDGVQRRAHRVSYQLNVGSVAKGLHVMHRCDNPACVNPDHLRVGTALDNARDRNAKGRQAKGERIHSAKLSADDVADIRASRDSVLDIAERYGVGRSQISKIRLGRKWQHTLPDDFVERPVGMRRSTEEIQEERELKRRARTANHVPATSIRGKGPGEAHSTAKLSEAQAQAILDSTESGLELARRYDVSPVTVSRIRNGHIWKHLTPSRTR